MKYYFSLGSNLGDSLEILRSAVGLMREYCEIEAVSGLYRTAPQGYEDQNDFLNLALRGECALEPERLLERTQATERALGKKKLFLNGPRRVDIDILWCRGRTVESDRLTLPHPRMFERAFVLIPLAEVWRESEPLDIPGRVKLQRCEKIKEIL